MNLKMTPPRRVGLIAIAPKVFLIVCAALSASQFVLLFSIKTESSKLVSNATNNLKALCPTKCSKILGHNGTWIQDWNYSATHGQYPSRVIPNKPFVQKNHGKFQPSDDAPFPWPTSFRWVDSNSLDEGCQIDYTMTAATFCDALLKLDVGMVIFSGDSLTWSMRRSLFNKMGKENVQNVTNRAWNKEAGFSGHLICKDSSSSDKVKSIPVFQQVATGGDWGGPTQNISFDNVTRDLIHSTPNRVLAIYNFGPHYHSMDSYTNDFDQLLEWLEHQYHRPHDLVFFEQACLVTQTVNHESPRNLTFSMEQGNILLSPLQITSQVMHMTGI
jgi:hypothetical protein